MTTPHEFKMMGCTGRREALGQFIADNPGSTVVDMMHRFNATKQMILRLLRQMVYLGKVKPGDCDVSWDRIKKLDRRKKRRVV